MGTNSVNREEDIALAAEEYKRWNVRKHFLDYTQDITKPVAVLSDARDNEKIIVSEGNFSIIRGQAKSFKSGLCVLFGKEFFEQQQKGILLYVDTEQGDYHATNIPRRICRALKPNYKAVYKDAMELYTEMHQSGRLILAGLRKSATEERASIFEDMLKMVREDNPDAPILVVLDGARDLVSEANEEKPSRELVDKLLELTSELKIGMLCVIHTRKDGTASLGHVGGELEKKGEQIIEVTRIEGRKAAKVSCLPSRNPEFEDFEMELDQYGIPHRCETPSQIAARKLGTKKETSCLNGIPKETHTRKEWISIIRYSGEGCGESTAEGYFNDFVREGYLIPTNKEGTHFAHWMLKGNEPMKPEVVPMPSFASELYDQEQEDPF